MGILNIGSQALQANLVALQTAGNNIANVNTAGYSRQKAVLETVPGQFTGGGYIGKGVAVQTIQRNYDAFLNRQATMATATQSADVTRADYLKQLGDIFQGGSSGLGASVNDMLNAFSDVASAPTDLTARTVALTRVDESARRMRAASQSLDDLQSGISQALGEKVNAINTLAQNIADVNQQISRAQGQGQPPNDLLDKRDQLVRDLNRYVQTTSIAATDGTLGIFIGGSQALVLGTEVAPVSIVADEYGDPLKNKLAITRSGATVILDENTLNGGEVPGLLRFQNADLTEGRNLLGRLTLGITTAMNDQHKLGLDLDGTVGGNLFTPTDMNVGTVYQSTGQIPLAKLALGISDVTKFAASDYEIAFTAAGAGTITRKTDGVVTNFTTDPVTGAYQFQTGLDTLGAPVYANNIDGLTIAPDATNPPGVGTRFLLKPFSTAASNIGREFATPRALAVSSPLATAMNPTNTGSLVLTSLSSKTVATTLATAPQPNFSISFTKNAAGAIEYSIADNTVTPANTVAGPTAYVSGQPIVYTPAPIAGVLQPGFSITLTGTPTVTATGSDSLTIKQNIYADLSGGNATALMDLRDLAMFDGAAMTDGYAGLISQVGIRAQSANYSAQVSTNIAVNADKNRAGVSGVNLDEEAAKLLQYQQAYQASAKMVQIAQNIFDTLIQGLGR